MCKKSIRFEILENFDIDLKEFFKNNSLIIDNQDMLNKQVKEILIFAFFSI